MSSNITVYGYDASPYFERTCMALVFKGLKYNLVRQPMIMPRPDLALINVNYRRIPVVAIGRDIYADSSLIMEVLEAKYGKEKSLIPSGSEGYIYALEQFANNKLFPLAVRLIQGSNDVFTKDRQSIWPAFDPAKFQQMRQHTLAEFRALLHSMEQNVFKSTTLWILPGSEPTAADINLAFVLKFGLISMGAQKTPGFGPKDFPNLHAWLRRLLKLFNEKQKSLVTEIDGTTAKELITGSLDPYAVAEHTADPLGLNPGQEVTVITSDARNTHPQAGTLIALNAQEAVIDLNNGLHMHFPRINFHVAKAGKSKL